MRNFALIVFSFLIACSPQAEKIEAPRKLEFPSGLKLKSTGKKALWMVTSNYSTGGRLVRLDLESGLITPTGVVGADAELVDDGDSFFILSRLSNDSIGRVADSTGKIGNVFRLPPRSNPQWAARDSLNRVWVTMQEIDDVLILDSELRVELGRVDLSFFKTADGNATLGAIQMFDHHRMLVTAQRIHRTANKWVPDFSSGIALINLNLQVDAHNLISLTNPIAIRNFNGETEVVGGGDYSEHLLENGAFSAIDQYGRSKSHYAVHGNTQKIVKIAPHSDTYIRLDNVFKIGCIVSNRKALYCEESLAEGGYVFSAIHQVGDVIFVAYKGNRKSELWIMSASEAFATHKFTIDLPIMSFAFGP